MTLRGAQTHANSIILRRQQHKGTFLVVEGRDDRLFSEQFVNKGACKVAVVEGKDNVLDTIRLLEEKHFPGIIGLVDADFDLINGTALDSKNIVRSAVHDLETMLFASAAFDRVMVEYGSTDKLNSLGRPPREVLLDLARPIGCLRLHSQRHSLNLNFDDLALANCVSSDLTIDISCVVSLVKNKSNRHDLDSKELMMQIQQLLDLKHNDLSLCCGEDLIALLGICLRTHLGTNNTSTVNGENLKRALRLAYSVEDFARSELMMAFREWESKHEPFQIIAKNT